MPDNQDAVATDTPHEAAREEPIRKWRRIWREAGVRFACQSLESRNGQPRLRDGLTGDIPVKFVPLAPGDIVALSEGTLPTEANQRLHPVVDLVRASDGGGYVARLGPVIPRLEWPEAMRAATVPSLLHAENVGEHGALVVRLTNGKGNPVFQVECRTGGIELEEGFWPKTIADAAWQGYVDGNEGRRRFHELVEGAAGPGGEPRWRITDGAGEGEDVGRRTKPPRELPDFAEAVLMAKRIAYAEGRQEALDVKARAGREMEDEAPLPRM
jgi:hypothetical protein